MLLGSEAFLVRCSELNVFSEMNAWACQCISTLAQKTCTDESDGQSEPSTYLNADRTNAEQASRLTNPANVSNWWVALLVHHVATSEAQASLRLMKALGNRLQAGCDHRSGYPCLDVTAANSIQICHHLFIKYNGF